jgi:hypothetical protein
MAGYKEAATPEMTREEFKELAGRIMRGLVPPGSDEWAAVGPDGEVAAHLAAQLRRLPEGFENWGLRDGSGWTVAHQAAFGGRPFPDDFDGWDLADADGWTVREVAEWSGVMDKMLAGEIPADSDLWETRSGSAGWTVAHSAASLRLLPKGFDNWSLRDGRGRTVAHVAAARGRLPEDFDGWGLADADGLTVADVAAARGGGLGKEEDS